MCVESEWPSSQTFHSSDQKHRGFIRFLSNDVDDAEGRDREQVGDEATGGKRTKGTLNKDMTKRWQWFLEKCATLTPFTLSQCRCDNIGKMRINV